MSFGLSKERKQKSKLNNNGKFLKIFGLSTFILKEPSFNSKSNILDYKVLLDDKFFRKLFSIRGFDRRSPNRTLFRNFQSFIIKS